MGEQDYNVPQITCDNEICAVKYTIKSTGIKCVGTHCRRCRQVNLHCYILGVVRETGLQSSVD